MANKVLISALVGAALGAGVALYFRPAPTVVWGVTVQSEPPQLSRNPLEIWKPNDQVQWVANPNSKYLYIEFEQKIFTNAIPWNNRFRVKCNKDKCDSGAILLSLPQGPTDGLGYKYWHGLADSPVALPTWVPNGRIIIKP